MKAWQFDSTTKALLPADVATPTPGPSELLVKVSAAGVTPTELAWFPTTHNKTGESRIKAIPGHEFSGTVAAVGEGVRDLEPATEIFGMSDWFLDGATAEYCIARPEWIAKKPAALSHLEAGIVPIGALTAWQGLFDRAKLLAGERILVQGGSGSVGSFVVQLAKMANAHVTATASAGNLDLLRRIGADTAIDYRDPSKPVEKFDVVFDTVGGATLARSWSLLRPGGRMITVAADGESTSDERTKSAFFIVEPIAEQLRKTAALLEEKSLVAVINAVVPFAKADAAYARAITGSGQGKVVIDMESITR